MTTYRTGNPIGSTDPRDLYDNAENLDELVNSQDKAEHPDRLGVPRKTWHSIEEQVAQQEAEFDADQARRESEFVDAQEDKQQRFNLLLANSGYEYLADYAAGIEVTEYNQVLRDPAGELWRAAATTTLPYTTDGTGLPESGAFVSAGDAVLRNDLAQDSGAGLIAAGVVMHRDSIGALLSIDTTAIPDGQQASTPEGVFIWHSARESWIPAEHSGGPMPIVVQDAMWSWWAKPCLLRHVDNLVNKTYMTFSQNDGSVGIAVFDHLRRQAHRYIINRDFTPDDHNTGAVAVGDGRVAAFYPGRRHTAGSSGSLYYVEFAEGDDPRNAQWTQLTMGGNYPNAYVSDGSLLLLARNSQTGTQWRTRVADWPLDNIQNARGFFASSTTWPYFTTRRSRNDSGIVNFALGWHPESEDYSDIHVGRFVRHGQSDPWDVESGGSVVANLTTGSGLPLTESEFEKAYEAPLGERTRLFDVHDDAIAFCRYPDGQPEDGEYMMAYRDGASWNVVKISDSGQAFYLPSNYFGGMSIDDDNIFSVWVAREDGGEWYRENYISEDSGLSWRLTAQYVGSKNTGSSVVSARPMAEVASQTTDLLTDPKVLFFSGRYALSNYENFNSDISEAHDGEFPEASSYSISSEGSVASGIASGVFASRDSESTPLPPMGFSAVIASDASRSRGRASAIIASEGSEILPSDSGSRRGNIIAASIDCSIASDTLASGIYSSVSSDIVSGYRNAIFASEECYIDSPRNSFIAGSLDSGVLNLHAFVIGSTRSSAEAGNSGVISSANSQVSGARSLVLSSSLTRITAVDTVGGGYAASGEPSTANRTWQVSGRTGNVSIAGSLSEGVNFSDIAKMIQNGEGSEIEPGYLLTLIGEKVYKAKEGERVDAIVAATPGIIQNDSPFAWQGRYLLDEWGRRKTQEVEWVAFEGYEGLASDAPDDIPEDAVYSTIEVPIENPEYDPEQENVPRSERPDEWVLAGVHGIIRTRVDGSVTQAAVDAAEATRDVLYIETGGVPGIGRLAQGVTNVQVMAVEKEFDGEYGIARCLLR